METKDLILRKAEFDDWKAMYRNVWSHPETARYMMWRVTKTEEAARERIRRTIEFQREHDTFFVCEKKSGQPIGFAGWEELAPHSFRETGIALGPEYVGFPGRKGILLLCPSEKYGLQCPGSVLRFRLSAIRAED